MKPTWTARLIAAGLCASLVFAAGCGSDESSGGGKAEKGQISKVSMVSSVWVGTAPFVIAHAEGLDRDNGIDLDIKTIEEFKDITSALGSGRADVGYSVGPGQALTMRQAEIPIKIIMVGDVSVGGDQILTGNDDIQSAEDLKGRSVGIETATTGYPMLVHALREAGLSLDDIKKVELTASQAAVALQTDRVDAAYTFEPYVSQARKEGFRTVYKAGDEPGIISDLLVASEDFLDKEPDNAVAVLKTWQAGLDYIRERPKKAYKVVADELGFPPKEVSTFFDPDVLEFYDIPAAAEYLETEFSNLLPTFVSVVNDTPDAPRDLSDEDAQATVDSGPLQEAASLQSGE